MIEVKTKEELDNVLAKNEKVIIKIGSEFCGPCKQTEKNILKVEENNSDVVFVKIDTDEASEELIEFFNVMSIPVLIKIVSGEIVDKFIGAKTEKQLIDFWNDEAN